MDSIRCPECGAEISSAVWRCPTCQADIGAPNVRECNTPREKEELQKRLKQALSNADNRGHGKEFRAFLKELRENSGVVVAMPPASALLLARDPRNIYANYELLVSGGMRTPASVEPDRIRAQVGGALFGSYAREIRYGALSLTSEGIATYGVVFARLRAVAIKKRVTFTECNSYTFVNNCYITPDEQVAPGRRAVWGNRAVLAAAKLEPSISKGQATSDWQRILVLTDGKDRRKDDFVEAHIFGAFDINAVESMTLSTTHKPSREDAMDGKRAVAVFSKLRASNGVPI